MRSRKAIQNLLLVLSSTLMLGEVQAADPAIPSDAAVASADNIVTPVEVNESSFQCIRNMTPVRHFFVDNLLGQEAKEATLAVANNPEGKIYPPGSVVQLVPSEVMVKREPGFSPATGDWEFFELHVDESGSKILKRGFIEVNNRFGKNCFACHAPAREKFDFICETTHGCEPIPIDHKMTGALQRSDPRCGPAVPEDGDTWALLKLKALVIMGSVMEWFKGLSS